MITLSYQKEQNTQPKYMQAMPIFRFSMKDIATKDNRFPLKFTLHYDAGRE